MSSTSGLSNQVTNFSSADVVQQQISSVDDQIQGLNQDLQSIGNSIQNLVAQLQGMMPPSPPSDPNDKSAMQTYQIEMANYLQQKQNLQGKIDDLNRQSQDIASKITQLQDKVQGMEGTDLPNAQRRDTQRQQEQLKQQQDTYESMAKSIDAGASSDADRSDKQSDVKKAQMRVGTDAGVTTGETAALQLRVSWRNSQVQLDPNSDLKTLVKAFQVHMTMVGDGTDVARRNNAAVAMPYTPGAGLPPVGTP